MYRLFQLCLLGKVQAEEIDSLFLNGPNWVAMIVICSLFISFPPLFSGRNNQEEVVSLFLCFRPFGTMFYLTWNLKVSIKGLHLFS